MHLPAYCSHCGAIFPSQLGHFNGVIGLTISGNNSEPCPNCGQSASVISGTFDVLDGAITVKAAPPETLAILQALKRAQAALKAGKPEAEVARQIEQDSPDVADIIKRIGQSPVWTPLGLGAVIMATIAACQIQIKVEAKLDLNRLVDQCCMTAPQHPASSAETSATAPEQAEEKKATPPKPGSRSGPPQRPNMRPAPPKKPAP